MLQLLGDRRGSNPHIPEPQSAPLSISGTATIRRVRLELTASRVSGGRSNQLNYLRRFRNDSNAPLPGRNRAFSPLDYGSLSIANRTRTDILRVGDESTVLCAMAIWRRHSDLNGDTALATTRGFQGHSLAN